MIESFLLKSDKKGARPNIESEMGHRPHQPSIRLASLSLSIRMGDRGGFNKFGGK